MARTPKAACSSCAGPIGIGTPFCTHCGHPTPWANHDQRIEWEVGQWRAARSRSGSTETIEPRPSRHSNVAVAEFRSPPEGLPANAVWDTPAPAETRESLFARLRRLLSRLSALFNARIEPSASARPALVDQAGDVAAEAVARPTLVVVPDPEIEGPGADPVETRVAPLAIEPAPATSDVAIPPPALTDPATPEVAVPLPAASERPALETGSPAPDGPEASPHRVVKSESGSHPVAPAASAVPAAPRATTPRKRPNRPTNKELLQRTLKTLERVEQRLHHLEREVTGIDEAVRKTGTIPADASDDDDVAPPPSGFVGYI